MTRGVTGLRLFTGGSTKGFDPSALDDPRSFPAWALCAEAGVPICVQTDPTGLAQVAGLAKRFPKAKIILDHLSRPDLSDGAPYKKASSLFGLQPFENVYLKLTPRTVAKATTAPATPETFFPKLIEVFGSHRIAWGFELPGLSRAARHDSRRGEEGIALPVGRRSGMDLREDSADAVSKSRQFAVVRRA